MRQSRMLIQQSDRPTTGVIALAFGAAERAEQGRAVVVDEFGIARNTRPSDPMRNGHYANVAFL